MAGSKHITFKEGGYCQPAATLSLLDRCKSGSEAAWEAFFSEWTPQIYRWAVLLGLGASDAEDAAQDVLATAARRIETCECQRAVRSWLFQITRRTVANVRRSRWWRRILPVGSGLEPAFEHEDQADAELELAIRSCLNLLPPSQVEVLVLIEIEGLTRKEAAELLELPEGTVASRLRQAKTTFKRHWERGHSSRPARLSWEER
jgi:RNA polymerase sigma-70 factor (ECF subfamily)